MAAARVDVGKVLHIDQEASRLVRVERQQPAVGREAAAALAPTELNRLALAGQRQDEHRLAGPETDVASIGGPVRQDDLRCRSCAGTRVPQRRCRLAARSIQGVACSRAPTRRRSSVRRATRRAPSLGGRVRGDGRALAGRDVERPDVLRPSVSGSLLTTASREPSGENAACE